MTTATVGACGQFCFSCGPNGPCLAKNWLNCELRAERGRSAVFLECAETDAHDFLRGWKAGDGWWVQEEMHSITARLVSQWKTQQDPFSCYTGHYTLCTSCVPEACVSQQSTRRVFHTVKFTHFTQSPRLYRVHDAHDACACGHAHACELTRLTIGILLCVARARVSTPGT